ncbi:MAG: hypothetical protein A3I12_05715 [Gammaproteobacteria bacterium RIFCSPLOWO2_02_FULL_38_11]|nr:MAG: hypothetical protein A3I12_05715 [Gammaproteobacteria bacterium RIFCSPLOWO2_02_FULL_38_11]
MFRFKYSTSPAKSAAALECSQEEIDYFERIVKIFYYFASRYPMREDFLPHWDRVPFNGGIGLRLYYGIPHSLLTSFGRLILPFNCGLQSSEIESHHQKVTKDLGLKLILEKKQNSYGAFGPIFSITHDEEGCYKFPEPSLEKMTVFENFTSLSPQEEEHLEQLFKAWKDGIEERSMKIMRQSSLNY